MDLERCSEKKLLETIKLFEKYLSPANQLAQSKAIMQGLVSKYAATGCVEFPQKLLAAFAKQK